MSHFYSGQKSVNGKGSFSEQSGRKQSKQQKSFQMRGLNADNEHILLLEKKKVASLDCQNEHSSNKNKRSSIQVVSDECQIESISEVDQSKMTDGWELDLTPSYNFILSYSLILTNSHASNQNGGFQLQGTRTFSYQEITDHSKMLKLDSSVSRNNSANQSSLQYRRQSLIHQKNYHQKSYQSDAPNENLLPEDINQTSQFDLSQIYSKSKNQPKPMQDINQQKAENTLKKLVQNNSLNIYISLQVVLLLNYIDKRLFRQIYKLVISVNIQKFRFEIAINSDATIQELVRSMPDTNFFFEDIKTEDLLFFNKNGEALNLQDKVESIVVEPTQPINFLDVQMKNQMEIDQSSMQGLSVVSQSQKSEVKTNPSSKILQENPISVLYKQFDEAPSKLKPEKVIKFLEAVQRGLEDNDLDDFINYGSSSEISKSIRSIAIKCRELLNEKKFFEQICFGIIPISRPEELSTFTREILEQEFKGERSIDEYLFDIAMNLYELKQRDLTGQQTILKEKNDKKKVSQDLQNVKKQNQAQKKEIACLKIEIQTKQLDLNAMVKSKEEEILNLKTLLKQMEQNSRVSDKGSLADA